MRGHFAYFKKNADSAFFNHNGGQTSMNQNERVNFFECLRPKLTIFEVKPSIHRLGYRTIARTHSISKASTLAGSYTTSKGKTSSSLQCDKI